MNVTFHRETAVRREDLVFLSWDHPMITDAIELLLSGQTGNTSVCRRFGGDSAQVVLEAVFVLECLSPVALYADRFLPPVAVTVAVNRRREVVEVLPVFGWGDLHPLPALEAAARIEALGDGLAAMHRQAQQEAERKAGRLRRRAIAVMRKRLGREARRLTALAQVNPQVRREEIELAVDEIRQLEKHLASARLRLDALRLTFVEPEGSRAEA